MASSLPKIQGNVSSAVASKLKEFQAEYDCSQSKALQLILESFFGLGDLPGIESHSSDIDELKQRVSSIEERERDLIAKRGQGCFKLAAKK